MSGLAQSLERGGKRPCSHRRLVKSAKSTSMQTIFGILIRRNLKNMLLQEKSRVHAAHRPGSLL